MTVGGVELNVTIRTVVGVSILACLLFTHVMEKLYVIMMIAWKTEQNKRVYYSNLTCALISRTVYWPVAMHFSQACQQG